MITKVQPYEKLVDYVKQNPQKGQLIPHVDIEQIIGIPYRKVCGCLNGKYSREVAKAIEKLTSMALRLDPIQGYGYRILEDNQYVDVMGRLYNTSITFMEKARFVADGADVSNLSAQDLKNFNDVYNRIVSAQTALHRIPKPVATLKSTP